MFTDIWSLIIGVNTLSVAFKTRLNDAWKAGQWFHVIQLYVSIVCQPMVAPSMRRFNSICLVTSCRNYTCWTIFLSFADQKNLVPLRPSGRREEGYVIASSNYTLQYFCKICFTLIY